MNQYESGSRKIIPATLIYAKLNDPQKNNMWLMMKRDQKKNDFHAGKYNGLGGKLEAGEGAVAGAIREFHEESGVLLSSTEFQMMGTLQFPLFKRAKNEDWLVFVFKAMLPLALDQDKLLSVQNSEGKLGFFSETAILNELPLWPGDRIFLPALFNGKFFSGCFRYDATGALADYEFHAFTG